MAWSMKAGSRGIILGVSTNFATRGYLRRILTAWGFEFLEAATPALAAEAVRLHPVGLVFLDLTLTEAETVGLIGLLLGARPSLYVALISTGPEAYQFPDDGQGRVLACLGMPLRVERIDRVVSRVFGDL